jgi:hypothetical protein
MSEFDEPGLHAAMRAYLDAADRLDRADHDADGEAARAVLDLAQAKSIAAITLHRRLRDSGWTPPAHAAGEGLGVARQNDG